MNSQDKPDNQSPESNPQSSNQSQSFGNITVTGKGNNFNPRNNVNIDQSRTEIIGQNSESELASALAALIKLKQEIAATNSLNSIQKQQAEIPVKMIETELQKSQPNKSLIDEAVEALKKGLEGVEVLAGPVMKVAAILAKVWV
ncbi:MAG: hypothetical protein F6K54_19645 [Okeania sp. SIO3B5]|uniref:hypothetical protein n=1 Tax=Okeania sp. SIO3B5 TaxID=2607811 RepID=UPI001400DAB4|nr:hypothetical protein [Okeania sp. SIO3B5]NEO55094.1 hypothetical protein [Okeania sp. SIO3B5]